MLGIVAFGHAQAEQPPAPSDELLEYLGQFEEADQDWGDLVVAAAAARQAPKQTDAVPAAKPKAEK
jgi:hypothetical protein